MQAYNIVCFTFVSVTVKIKLCRAQKHRKGDANEINIKAFVPRISGKRFTYKPQRLLGRRQE